MQGAAPHRTPAMTPPLKAAEQPLLAASPVRPAAADADGHCRLSLLSCASQSSSACCCCGVTGLSLS